MSTAGPDPRLNERSETNKSKRSFLQRLNRRHGNLSLHMRSKRGEKRAHQNHQPGVHSPPATSSHYEAPQSPSALSTSTVERKHSESQSQYYDVDDDVSPTNLNFPAEVQEESDFNVPIQYVVAQNDREGSHDFIQGMQEFLLRKQASTLSRSEHSSYRQPIDSPQRSLRGSPSEMSDEQIDDWLDKPVNADLHRERKSSEESLKAKAQEDRANSQSRLSTEEAPKLELSNYGLTPVFEGLNMQMGRGRETADPTTTGGSTTQSIDSSEEKTTALPSPRKSNPQRLLSLPDELLQEITSYLDTNSAWLFRLSCNRLYNAIPTPPTPEGTESELDAFFAQTQSFFPSDFKYCIECAQYHSWTPDDFYLRIHRVGSPTQFCRRYLASGRQPTEKILGTDRFLCDTCNIVRPGKQCKTCGKCETCARLRRTWMLISWVEDECDYCAASHSPKWKHWKGEFEGRVNPGEQREWMGV